MNIVEACRLLDKFGGYISMFKSTEVAQFIYLNRELRFSNAEGVEDFECDVDFTPIISELVFENWLYYNDKFECLTCETCDKLLNEMEGLAPVCECEERTIKSAPKQGNIPREDVQAAIKKVLGSKPPTAEEASKACIEAIKKEAEAILDSTPLYPSISRAHQENNDDCICPACEAIKREAAKEERTIKSAPKQGNIQLQAVISSRLAPGKYTHTPSKEQLQAYIETGDENYLVADTEKLDSLKSKEDVISDAVKTVLATGAMATEQVMSRLSNQYPGMIEVNYFGDITMVIHYTHIQMYHKENDYFVYDRNDGYACDYVVSPEEYHRILNLFKASGLEVSK